MAYRLSTITTTLLIILTYFLQPTTADYYASLPIPTPPTNVTHNYTLTIGYDTTSSVRPILTVNGISPGPIIESYAGDTLNVLVVNNLPINMSVSIHWHGQLQYQTPAMDGVPGVTQCAIPSGASFLYSFETHTAGTYWYHGHFNEIVYRWLVWTIGGARTTEQWW